MSECLATMDSGNYAHALVAELERDGYRFRVIPTPCRISRSGCGYCIKLPEEYIPVLREKSSQKGYTIREIFRVVPEDRKTQYVRIYPG